MRELFGIPVDTLVVVLAVALTAALGALGAFNLRTEVFAEARAVGGEEMRARYPRHPWPEDPAAAEPTTRAKARR